MTRILLCNLQVVHCDLALRNILVSHFPWEIKVAEFGLARDLTRMRSRRSTRKKHHRVRHWIILRKSLYYINPPVVYMLLSLGSSALALVSA